jgi:Mg-chelatase subunit ChlD
MASKRKADEPEDAASKKPTEAKPLVKKLTSFVQDVLKKHGKITLNDAKKLWELACDGPGVTPSEFHTLDHILSDEAIGMTEAARLHLHYLVTRQESGTSLYRKIDGVKYDRSCLDLAEHLFKDGKIDLGDAKQLWEEIEDGPGVTEVEKRTIEKIMVDKAEHLTSGATKFFNEKLAAWVNPKPKSGKIKTKTATSTATSSSTSSSSSSSSSTSSSSTSSVASSTTSSTTSSSAAVSTPVVSSPAVKKPSVSTVESKTTETKEIQAGERIELIVDRSGSMRSLLDATVKGLNEFIVQQQAEPGAAKRQLRLTTFNDVVSQPPAYHCGLSSVPPVTPEVVMSAGGTALLDAIGTVLSSLPVEQVSVVVIVTDGDENESKKFTQAQVNQLIADRMRSEWTFVFLAANQNAIATGAKYGLSAGSCATFTAVVDNVVAAFQAANQLASRSWKTVDVEQRSFTTNERSAMKN